MAKFCTDCGYQNLDEANFCSKCGFPLEDDDPSPFDANAPLKIPKKYDLFSITETSKCLNCNQNTSVKLKKSQFLSEKIVYFCTNCGMTLEKVGNYYKLVDILDKNNPMWLRYHSKQFKRDELEGIVRGGLSKKDQKEREKKIEDLQEELIQLQMEHDIDIFSQDLSLGKTYLRPVVSPIDLKENEEAYLSIANVKLSEPKISKNTSSEKSFKMAKGVTVKMGGKKVTNAPVKDLKEIDIGTFVITNKRVIFIGSEKTVNIDLRKILSINIFKDGVSIQRENKKKIEYFTETNPNTLTFEIYGREQTIALEGNIIRAMILGQIAKLLV